MVHRLDYDLVFNVNGTARCLTVTGTGESPAAARAQAEAQVRAYTARCSSVGEQAILVSMALRESTYDFVKVPPTSVRSSAWRPRSVRGWISRILQ